MVATGVLHHFLTGALRLAIDVQGVGHIILDVRALLFAIKHVIGRVMHQERPVVAGVIRHHPHSLGVDAESRLRLALGLVDRGVSRRVDDDRRRLRIQQPAQVFQIGQVGIALVERHDLAQRPQGAAQFGADLARAAEQQDFHAPYCLSIQAR